MDEPGEEEASRESDHDSSSSSIDTLDMDEPEEEETSRESDHDCSSSSIDTLDVDEPEELEEASRESDLNGSSSSIDTSHNGSADSDMEESSYDYTSSSEIETSSNESDSVMTEDSEEGSESDEASPGSSKVMSSHVKEIDIPLYDGAELSVFDSYLLLYQYAIRHSITQKAFSELITLVSAHLPKEAKVVVQAKDIF